MNAREEPTPAMKKPRVLIPMEHLTVRAIPVILVRDKRAIAQVEYCSSYTNLISKRTCKQSISSQVNYAIWMCLGSMGCHIVNGTLTCILYRQFGSTSLPSENKNVHSNYDIIFTRFNISAMKSIIREV